MDRPVKPGDDEDGRSAAKPSLSSRVSGAVRNILFVCGRNRLRSPTAEQVFAALPDVETDSGGVADDADTPVSAEQIAWADVIVVMERAHQRRLKRRFAAALAGKRVICLDIPDRYALMQPELVALLEARAHRFLR
jgi:predicted protein tyrosine phosphatase